jgi:hypothetical protein
MSKTIKYVTPRLIHVSRDDPGGERLYTAEHKLGQALEVSARAWIAVQAQADTREPGPEYWGEALPQALYDLLQNYGDRVAKIVAEATLAR